MAEPVKIVPSVLAQQVEEGMKLKPLAEHYGLPVTQMKAALKACDLKIRKFHAPKFVLEEESTEETVTDINVESEEVTTENTIEEQVAESEVQTAPTEEEVKTEKTQETARVSW